MESTAIPKIEARTIAVILNARYMVIVESDTRVAFDQEPQT